MKKYLLWLILSLPLWGIVLLWRKIPDEVVIHTASSDKFVDKDDFGGLVIAITAGAALVSYGLLQMESLSNPLPQKQLDKAYLFTCCGAAFVGLAFLCLGLIQR